MCASVCGGLCGLAVILLSLPVVVLQEISTHLPENVRNDSTPHGGGGGGTIKQRQERLFRVQTGLFFISNL